MGYNQLSKAEMIPRMCDCLARPSTEKCIHTKGHLNVISAFHICLSLCIAHAKDAHSYTTIKMQGNHALEMSTPCVGKLGTWTSVWSWTLPSVIGEGKFVVCHYEMD